VPWPAGQVEAVRVALAQKYRIVTAIGGGLGLRQGEILGLAPDDVDFLRGKVDVSRQVKLFRDGRMVFAPPKGNKTRTVPLPASVRDSLAAHLAANPAREVTLPWVDPDRTELVSVSLVLSTREGNAVSRTYFNRHVWKPALEAAGVPTTRENGCHALRHFYASVLLDGGESIKAVSEYLGHSDPGFTLRTYTHLMPSSDERTRRAVDAALGAGHHPTSIQHDVEKR
jgi:integrase